MAFGLVAFQMFYWRAHRDFMIWTLYPARFLLEFVPNLILVPIATAVGFGLSCALRSERATNVAALLLYFVFFVVWAVAAVVSRTLLFKSAYLQKSSPFSNVRAQEFQTWVVVGAICSGLELVMEIYAGWIQVIVIVAHLAMQAYGAYRFAALPCRGRMAGAVILGCQVSLVLQDLIAIIVLVSPWTIPFVAVFALGVVGLVVATIACHFWINWKFNKVVGQLDALVEEGVSAQDAQDLLAEYGLVHSRRTLNTFLNVALESGAEALINGAIPKQIMAHQDADPDEMVHMLAALLRVMILFPHESRRTGVLLRQLERKRGNEYPMRFLTWQSEKVRVIRTCSNSAIANAALREMKRMTSAVIHTQKGLWSLSENPWPAFRMLQDQIDAARADCVETIADFPVSVPHAEVLLDFLCEGATDFTHAIIERDRINQLEEGRLHAADLCFRSLVARYPVYFKKKLLGLKGEVLR